MYPFLGASLNKLIHLGKRVATPYFRIDFFRTEMLFEFQMNRTLNVLFSIRLL